MIDLKPSPLLLSLELLELLELQLDFLKSILPQISLLFLFSHRVARLSGLHDFLLHSRYLLLYLLSLDAIRVYMDVCRCHR